MAQKYGIGRRLANARTGIARGAGARPPPALALHAYRTRTVTDAEELPTERVFGVNLTFSFSLKGRCL